MLFGTQFSVMAETERRQTTKGIWLSKNKREKGGQGDNAVAIADNVLVMDVEGTDGRERGEDQDFERKSALFALATSEVLIVNIWLLKMVFEVNLQLFLKDKQYVLRYSTVCDKTNILPGRPPDPSYSSSSATTSERRPSRTSAIP